MRKIFLSALTLLSLVGLFSCSEKFNVAAPYKNITIVYGLMDQADTAHYIRIEKAFLDENKSAIDMAKNPDSIYFANLNVRMDVLSGSSVVGSISLKKVDLTAEGYPKDGGSFPSSPNYAYKFTDHLDPNYSYCLVVNNPVTGETDSGITTIIDESASNIPIFATSNAAFAIQRTSLGYTYRLNGTVSASAAIIQGIIRFHWVDVDASGKQTDKYGDWSLGTQNVGSTGGFGFNVNNIDFYYNMYSIIGPAPTGITRRLDSCDIYLYLGSADFSTYQQVTAVQSQGLTGDEIKPNYTNLKGTNVLGLFTSRGVIKDLNVPFNDESLDSLMVNPITQPLIIQGRSDH